MSGAPHLPQKLEEGGFSALHFAHELLSAFPHCAQKLLPGVLFVPHFVQRTGVPQTGRLALLYHRASRGDQQGCGPYVQDVIARTLRLGGSVDDELAVIAALPNKFFAVDPRGTRCTLYATLMVSLPCFPAAVLPFFSWIRMSTSQPRARR
jgi:hypothetical protein